MIRTRIRRNTSDMNEAYTLCMICTRIRRNTSDMNEAYTLCMIRTRIRGNTSDMNEAYHKKICLSHIQFCCYSVDNLV